jgi:uncharacterized membrane protein HdeD (DUF308 family)
MKIKGEENMTTAVETQTKQRPWWLTLISGIAALIVGAILLWSPAKTKVETYQLVIAFLGVWWLVQGVFDIVSIFIDHSMWGWKLFIGIISIAAGAYVLMYPTAAGIVLPRVLVLVLGIWGLMYGIVLLIMAFSGAGWGAGILGALGILLGIALMADYGKLYSGLAMLWSVAILGVIGGIALIFQAFRQRSAKA